MRLSLAGDRSTELFFRALMHPMILHTRTCRQGILPKDFDNDTLIFADASASHPPADLLRPEHAASAGGGARGARGPVQGARRPDPRRDRQPARGRRGGLRVRPELGIRALATDDLAPPEDPPGSRAGGVEPPRHLGLLSARARGGRLTEGSARRMTNVLFVCVQNAGRSQMAQAFYERRGGSARSAGSAPADEVHPVVVEAMAEVGIDLDGRVPRRLERADVEWADLVVTMGCGDACPVLPGKRYVDWDLPDPAGICLTGAREIRDEIARRVEQLPL